jgi:hypothetical protein
MRYHCNGDACIDGDPIKDDCADGIGENNKEVVEKIGVHFVNGGSPFIILASHLHTGQNSYDIVSREYIQ